MEIMMRSQARELGLKKYFTGEKCKNEHLTFRYTQSGSCADCIRAGNGAVMAGETYEEKRDAKQNLGRFNFYLRPLDREIFATAAWAAAGARYPCLEQSDIDPHLLPKNIAAGVNSYAFYCHPGDFEMLNALSAQLRGASVQAAEKTRQDALQSELRRAEAAAPAPPPMNWK